MALGPGEGSPPRVHVDVGQGPGVLMASSQGSDPGQLWGGTSLQMPPKTPLFPLEHIRGAWGSLLQAPGSRRGPCPGWGKKPQHLTGEAPLVTGSGLCHGSGHLRRDSPALDSGRTQGTWREFRAFGGMGHGKAWSYTSWTLPWAGGAARPGQGPAHGAGREGS